MRPFLTKSNSCVFIFLCIYKWGKNINFVHNKSAPRTQHLRSWFMEQMDSFCFFLFVFFWVKWNCCSSAAEGEVRNETSSSLTSVAQAPPPQQRNKTLVSVNPHGLEEYKKQKGKAFQASLYRRPHPCVKSFVSESCCSMFLESSVWVFDLSVSCSQSPHSPLVFQHNCKPSAPIRIRGLTCFHTLLPFNCSLPTGTDLPGWRQIKRRIHDDSTAATSSRTQLLQCQEMPACFLDNCGRNDCLLHLKQTNRQKKLLPAHVFLYRAQKPSSPSTITGSLIWRSTI